MRSAIYLDHNAAAPLLPEAREALVAALSLTGNPSSVHGHGRVLRDLVETARRDVAKIAGANADQVVFTGSATEAITQAIVGSRLLGVTRIVVSAGEHAAVLKAAEASGLPVTTIGLNPDGRVPASEIRGILSAAEASGETLLVCTHWVNNETGVVQPIAEISASVGPTRHYLFVDAVQALGKLELDFAGSAPDMMAVSGHKIGAPAGIGALLMKQHAERAKLIPGGGQEQGRRGGTEPWALTAAFGAAARAYPARLAAAHGPGLIQRLEEGIMAMAPGCVIFGIGADRIGTASNFAVPGLQNSVAMMGLDLAGVSVSSGSACSSGKVGPSHVLAAMGVAPALSECALRVSVGWNSTVADIDALLTHFHALLERHRARRGKAA